MNKDTYDDFLKRVRDHNRTMAKEAQRRMKVNELDALKDKAAPLGLEVQNTGGRTANIWHPISEHLLLFNEPYEAVKEALDLLSNVEIDMLRVTVPHEQNDET